MVCRLAPRALTASRFTLGLLLACLSCALDGPGAHSYAGSPPASPNRPVEPARAAAVSFQQEVLPILTRAGCNAGACHGTPAGKNGFHLSLRGYDAASDFRALTHEAGGRRLNRVQPGASLILLKAIAQVPHGGGLRLHQNSDQYLPLLNWISQGGLEDPAPVPPVERLEVSPAFHLLHEPVRE